MGKRGLAHAQRALSDNGIGGLASVKGSEDSLLFVPSTVPAAGGLREHPHAHHPARHAAGYRLIAPIGVRSPASL